MAREHEDKKEVAQQIVEREINLSLINVKLNEAINLLYKIAEKTGTKIEED
jgi:hypothetical protein